ncbi:gliding motility-associated C-terminal domain-containing protein [Mucilaginibacter sp.]
MRIIYGFVSLMLILLADTLYIKAQCLPNVGFEDGKFTNWECKAGTINLTTKQALLTVTEPIPGRHSMLTNTSPQQIDELGGFPVNCPNGSGHSIKLGNAIGGSEAESVTYTYNVPANTADFTLTYYYAIVLQNNSQHNEAEQAKFQAQIYNVTDNRYEACGTFQFSALAGNNGFIQGSTTVNGNNNSGTNTIYYKPWTPITVNLKNYQGKTIRLEFITRDCAPEQIGNHYAYAYIDVAENCKPFQTPITGNNYCLNEPGIVLKAPPGFAGYQWFNSSDLTTPIGTGANLPVSPVPADGTGYTVKLTPFPGYGCESTLTATAHANDAAYVFAVTGQQLRACESDGYDITRKEVTEGSSSDLVYEYFTDAEGQNYLSDPKRVTQSGTYYIRATNAFGCAETKSVQVVIEPNPPLTIVTLQPVCEPEKIDVTKAIRDRNDAFIDYTYWTNAAATQPLINPQSVSKSGIYYIKATYKLSANRKESCSTMRQAEVIIGPKPQVFTHDFSTCPPANLTNTEVIRNSTPGLSYTYWLDAAGTQQVSNPDKVTVSGTYYIKGTTDLGCSPDALAPVNVTVYPVPVLEVNDPNPVTYPATVNIGRSFIPAAGNTYSFWKDAATTVALANYTEIAESGKFYIKATNGYGCELIEPVTVIIYPPPLPQVIGPNTFTPNGDGINDLFKPAVEGIASINKLTIYNRWGQQVYESKASAPQWNGQYNGQLQATGTYYWVIEATDIYRKINFTRSGYIAIVK